MQLQIHCIANVPALTRRAMQWYEEKLGLKPVMEAVVGVSGQLYRPAASCG